MRKLYPGMVPLKNGQQQKAADNLSTMRSVLEAINPIIKYEKKQQEKLFMESQSNVQHWYNP